MVTLTPRFSKGQQLTADTHGLGYCMAEQFLNFFIRILKRKKKASLSRYEGHGNFKTPSHYRLLDLGFWTKFSKSSPNYNQADSELFTSLYFLCSQMKGLRNRGISIIQLWNFCLQRSQVSLLLLWDLMHKDIFRINILRNVEEHVLKGIPIY